jgi:hypothetical protein
VGGWEGREGGGRGGRNNKKIIKTIMLGGTQLSTYFTVPPLPSQLTANLAIFPGLQPTYNPTNYDFILQVLYHYITFSFLCFSFFLIASIITWNVDGRWIAPNMGC